MLERIKKTTSFIQSKVTVVPEIGIILGTGLGNLAENIENPEYVSYSEIPDFPQSTVKGHKGRFIFGTFSNKKVVAMQGRFHFYEGYDMKDVSFPIRVMKELGIKLLILSNAAGGMNPDFKVGDIMIIKDHINMMPTNPLMGPNIDELGPRFPDMSEAYDLSLVDKMKKIAIKENILLHEGVYVGVSGPCFETPSEYRAFRIIGGDAIGMSTVPEVIAARHGEIKCLACSVITDLGGGEIAEKVSHEEVLEAASKAEPVLTKLLNVFISEL